MCLGLLFWACLLQRLLALAFLALHALMAFLAACLHSLFHNSFFHNLLLECIWQTIAFFGVPLLFSQFYHAAYYLACCSPLCHPAFAQLMISLFPLLIL